MNDNNKDKDQAAEPGKNTGNKSPEKPRRSIHDKLRKKLDKLKKDDPNIYPVF